MDTAIRIAVAVCWLVCHFDPDSQHMFQVAAVTQRIKVLESGQNKKIGATRSQDAHIIACYLTIAAGVKQT